MLTIDKYFSRPWILDECGTYVRDSAGNKMFEFLLGDDIYRFGVVDLVNGVEKSPYAIRINEVALEKGCEVIEEDEEILMINGKRVLRIKGLCNIMRKGKTRKEAVEEQKKILQEIKNFICYKK